MRAWRRADASPLVPLAVIAVAVSVVALPLGAWQAATWVQERAIEAKAVRDNPGAAVLRDPSLAEIPADAELLPLPTLLDDEWVQLENPCAGGWSVDTELLLGTCFETSRTARADRTIVVIGDSHAQQMTGALLPVADENGWGVVSLVKGGCSMGLAEPGMDERCDGWREEAIALVERMSPDAVMTVVTRSDAGDDDEALRPGIEGFLDRMGDAGIPVLAVRDNPRFAYDMYGCVIEAEDPSTAPPPARPRWPTRTRRVSSIAPEWTCSTSRRGSAPTTSASA